MSARRRAVDPVQRELFRHAVAALVDEMAVAMVRTARSTHLKNSMDLSAALCDPAGRLIAQGLTLPLHLGSVPDAMRAFLARFGDELRPGDVYALNDPYSRRHAFAGYLHGAAGVPQRAGHRARGDHCAPRGRWRQDGWRQRLRRHGALPGRNLPAAGAADGRRRAGGTRLAAAGTQRAGPQPGAGRPTRPAGGGTRGRARPVGAGRRARAAPPGRPGHGGAGLRRRPSAAGNSRDSGRRLRLHRLPGRRRHRPRADTHPGHAARRGRPDHRRLHRVGTPGPGRHQLPAALHQVGGLCLRSLCDAHRHP